MKTKLTALLALCLSAAVSALAQGTAFTYQGQLDDVNGPANGHYDLTFTLFSTNTTGLAVAGPVTNTAVSVGNGLFTVLVDFGSGAFTGSSNWLQIGVKTNGAGAFTSLTPRQQLTPTPYAIYAESASSLPGLLVQPNTNGSPNLIGGASGNFVSSGVVGGTISGGGAANYGGSAYTNSVTADFGTVAGGRGNQASGQFATVGGGRGNQASGFSSTIAGGDGNTASLDDTFIGGGWGNSAPNYDATVSGGDNNTAGGYGSVVSGGEQNGAGGDHSTVGGGLQNNAAGAGDTLAGGLNNSSGGGNVSTISGGENNNSSGSDAVIGGGKNNSVSAFYSTVGGGVDNTATNMSAVVSGGTNNVSGGYASTVAGGANNAATGDYSMAAGFNAAATNDGSLVWSDGSGATTASTTSNSVTFRASNGYRFFTGTGAAGAQLLAGQTSWTTLSDRDAKKNFQGVNTVALLEKLAAIPIQQWNYQWENDRAVPNIGPMAQDFKAAFYPGRDDKSISTLEFDGVELAAIQGLNQKLEARSRELEVRSGKLQAENAELKARLEKLERLINAKNGRGK